MGLRLQMKREIKFRAWDNDYKKMVQSIVCETFELGISFEGVVIGFSQENSTKDKPAEVGIFPARFTPMQFTGLKDKNGKEIYEGDLITESVNSCKWIYEIRSCEEFGINLFKVLRYRNFDTDENGDHIYGDFWMDTVYSQLREGKYSIVIGNIYENPELLKQDTLCACKEVKEQDENTPEKR